MEIQKKKHWDKLSCIEFLRRFDAFEHKYLNIGDGNNANLTASFEKEERIIWGDVLNSQGHSIANHNFSTKEEAEAAQGIRQVYRDEKDYTNEYIEMLDLVRDRFIYDYTGIEGLCDFFSPAYFEYEWGMHLELDYNNYTSKFYRDHYVHQIRNMFEMFSLLDDFGYYKKCYDSYTDPENNIGTFIAEAINQEILSMNDTDKELYGKVLSLRKTATGERLRTCYKAYLNNASIAKVMPPVCSFGQRQQFDIRSEYSQTGLLSSFWGGAVDNNREELRDLMLHYIIYSAAIIASLAHDIGYPISYIRRVSDRLNKYLPVNRLLASITKDYSEIVRALQNSLLFSVVASPEKIEHRLNSSEEHGAQSAVVLLMYFHQHGGRLTGLQRCAIEIAALVIYNHTNKFSVINKPKEGKPETIPELVRSDIYKEPLSHIFRMCDDLQEWDRVYFEITDKNNIMICPNCKTPITRRFGTDICKPKQKKYYCCCTYPKSEVEPNVETGIYDTNGFVNRRILNVIGCNHMEVENNDVDRYTKFTMNYDCGALLNIMTFSTSYGRVRAKALKELKILHSYQGCHDSILVDCFVSGNPLTVKIQILKEYVKCFKERICILGKVRTDNWFSDSLKYVVNHLITTYKRNSNVSELLKHNLEFYIILYNIGKRFYNWCKKNLPNLIEGKPPVTKAYFKVSLDTTAKAYSEVSLNTTNKSVLDQYEKAYDELINVLKSEAKGRLELGLKKYRLNEAMIAMCCDYLLQQVHILGFERTRESLSPKIRTEDDIKLNNLYRQFYEKLYCSDVHLCELVDSYISRDAYDKVKELCIANLTDNYDTIDFFVDYALFINMWDDVKKTREFFFSSEEAKHNNDEDKNVISNDKTYLICLTPDASFRDEYVFRIWDKTEGFHLDRKLLTLRIDWEESTGICNMEDSVSKKEQDYLKALLSSLETHHCIKISFSEHSK